MFIGLLYKDIIKNIDEHPDGRDAKGKVPRGPWKELPPLWSRGGPPFQHMDVHQPGSSPNPTLGIFMTASSQRRERRLTQSPAPLLFLESERMS